MDIVRKERHFFRAILADTQSQFAGQGITSNPPTRPLTQLSIKAHYSFDFAQQVCTEYT